MAHSEIFYQSIIDYMSNAFAYHRIITDASGHPIDYEFIEVNPAFEKLTGLKKNDIIGNRITSVLPDIHKSSIDLIKLYGNVALEGRQEEFELYSGTLNKWYSVTAYSPQEGYFVTIFNDITDIKQNQEDREIFTKLAADLECIIGFDGYFKKIDSSWTSLLGWSEEELLACPYLKVVHPTDRRTSFQTVKHLLQQDDIIRIDNRFMCKDGSYRWLSWKVCSVNKRGLIYASAHDITDSKQAEAELQEQNKDFLAFSNSVDIIIFIMDLNGSIIRVNFAAIEQLGYSEEELLGSNIFMVHPPEDRGAAQKIISAIATGDDQSYPFPLQTKQGKYLPVESKVFKGRWSNEDVLFGIIKDISDLKWSEKKFFLAFNLNASLMAISTLREGRIVNVNESFCDKLGYRREEVLGRSALELGIFMNTMILEQRLRIVLEQGKIRDFEAVARTKNGAELIGLYSAEKFNIGEEKFVLTMFTDITERRKMEAELQERNQQLHDLNARLEIQAITDSLTNLYNHRYIVECLQLEVDRAMRYHHPLTILMLDLDHFKEVNDNYGHQCGDQVLIAVAGIIKKNLREVDLAGRYGGEEFMLILPHTSLNGGLVIAERIRHQLQVSRCVNNNLKVTISIGVAQYDREGIKKFIDRADEIMYQAKNNGRNRVEC